MKIAVLISGGVDSSVALRLLKDEGHFLTAFYLKIWLEDELSYLGNCPWEEDLEYVRQVCDEADVPLEVISMQKEYWDNVVKYTINECKAGRTPNPDIFCNQMIKFGSFYDKVFRKPLKKVFGLSKISEFASPKVHDASRTSLRGTHETHSGFRYASSLSSKLTNFDKVATGHYAQVEEKDGIFYLKKAPDPVKDQTYFLSYLNQDQLSRAMFPIGKYKKDEVRKLAKKYNLPNKDRKDSQGICFLGKIPYREFIKEHLGEKTGDFVNQNNGEVVGQHKGHFLYTIGQRTGLGLSGGPWFVVNKDVKKNIIYLANGYDPKEVYKDEFEVINLNWIDPNLKFKIENLKLKIKIRHGASIHDCIVKSVGDRLHIKLKKSVHGVAPGQFAVFYDDQICLGGGMII